MYAIAEFVGETVDLGPARHEELGVVERHEAPLEARAPEKSHFPANGGRTIQLSALTLTHVFTRMPHV
jgi:hypothetical protein